MYQNPDPCAPIGVFDSGVGGLTVAREIMRQLPGERIVYFGDTARVPYGSKSRQTILRYSKQIIRFLETKRIKAVVVACNTASALALDEILPELSIPAIGVIGPGARVAAQMTRNKKVGVIATLSTIESHSYTDAIHAVDPSIQVLGKACPLFVPLVEEGWINDPVTKEVARRYLDPLTQSGIDTLIMGCTHYPLLRDVFAQMMGDEVTLVNPAYETARALGEQLKSLSLSNDGTIPAGGPRHEFYVSDNSGRFIHFANSILPYGVEQTKLVAIEEY